MGGCGRRWREGARPTDCVYCNNYRWHVGASAPTASNKCINEKRISGVCVVLCSVCVLLSCVCVLLVNSQLNLLPDADPVRCCCFGMLFRSGSERPWALGAVRNPDSCVLVGEREASEYVGMCRDCVQCLLCVSVANNFGESTRPEDRSVVCVFVCVWVRCAHM